MSKMAQDRMMRLLRECQTEAAREGMLESKNSSHSKLIAIAGIAAVVILVIVFLPTHGGRIEVYTNPIININPTAQK